MKQLLSMAVGAILSTPFVAASAASSPGAAQEQIPITVTYQAATVDGLKIFYREAGDRRNPTVLLLHGFPSSSRMYAKLIPALAGKYHVVAPDYPGFGHSDAPPPGTFAYTFGHLAAVMDGFVQKLGITHYSLFVQDYGGPVGFRMALSHPERVDAIIVQNAVSHDEGLGPLWEVRRQYWANRAAYVDKLRANLISLDAARQRHVGNDPHPEIYDPDTWTDESAFLSRPDEARIQEDLFYDYRTNVASYPIWQEYLRQHQPALLVVWGKYDPSFVEAGAWAYRKEVPNAEVHILDAGHFALDTKADEVAALTLAFLNKRHDEATERHAAER